MQDEAGEKRRGRKSGGNFRGLAVSGNFYFRPRMNLIKPLIWSSVNLPSNFGILFLPSLVILARSASDSFATSGAWKSLTPIFCPAPLPLPSAPWQTWHFDLYRASASSAAAG